MNCREYEMKHDDCPICGLKEGATMGSSRWGHNYTCCSDECGLELERQLNSLYRSKYWKTLEKKRDKITSQMKKIESQITKEQVSIHDELMGRW